MTNEEIEKIVHMNQRLSLILGYAVGMLREPTSNVDDEYWKKYNWLMNSIENIFYSDKPLSKMP